MGLSNMSEKINSPSKSAYEIMLSRRSIRRFQQKPVNMELLRKFVNAARLAPSAANLQPLEFFIVTEKDMRSKIFETISWAGYIKPAWKPEKDKRPTAYIVILVRDIANKYYPRDVGLASENIVLASEEEHIGSCILCKIEKDKIKEILKIPDTLHVDSLIALGYKAEQAVIEDFKDSIKYWRDKNEILHVPKRKLESIIHVNEF